MLLLFAFFQVLQLLFAVLLLQAHPVVHHLLLVPHQAVLLAQVVHHLLLPVLHLAQQVKVSVMLTVSLIVQTVLFLLVLLIILV